MLLRYVFICVKIADDHSERSGAQKAQKYNKSGVAFYALLALHMVV